MPSSAFLSPSPLPRPLSSLPTSSSISPHRPSPTAQVAPNRPQPTPSPSSQPPPPSEKPAPPGSTTDVNFPPSALPPFTPPPVRGTLYLQIPSHAPHLAATSKTLAHPRDGDGYVLAISFSDAGTWVRGRYVRTKPYMREAREGRVVYKGRYGTPGSRGLAAPVKWKRSCAAGLFVWTDKEKTRLVAFGDAGLPMAIDGATLASRGPVGLGVLTDAPELASVKCAEVGAVVGEGRVVVCAKARGGSGRVTGVAVYEVGGGEETVESRRYGFPAEGVVGGFGVSDGWYAVLYSQMGGGLKKLLGGGSGSGVLDASFGTKVRLIPRGKGKSVEAELVGVYVTGCVRAVDDDEGVVLDLNVVYVESAKSLAQLADAADGRHGCAKTTLRRYRVRSSGEVEVVTEDLYSAVPELSPYRTAYSESTDAYISVVTDNSQRCGVAVVKNSGVVERWDAGNWRGGSLLSGPILLDGGRYVAVLLSDEEGQSSRVVVLDSSDVGAGPVSDVGMPGMQFGPCIGGAWSDQIYTWEDFGEKKPTSSYELFDDKRWNDVNNGFSSFGINQ